jgi:hypothetical protein
MAKGVGRRLVPPGKFPNKLTVKPVTSLKLSRKIIGRFHALQAARASARGAEALRALDAEEAALGGRQAYQAAAALSTSAFRASRWVFKTLIAAGLQPPAGGLPLRVLELGAVNAQLSSCPWLRVRAIDLLSRHAAVETKDFFDVPIGSGPTGWPADVAPAACAAAAAAAGRDRVWGAAPSRLRALGWGPVDAGAYVAVPGGAAVLTARAPRAGAPAPVTGAYDVVVNAMVLNCVFCPQQRARMLVMCRDHLVAGGLLYLALPHRCLDASRFLTRAMFDALLRALGFVLRAEKRTPKITMLLLQRVDVLPAVAVWGGAGGAGGGSLVAAGPLHGAGWAPRIVPVDAAERALLARLAGEGGAPTPLPVGEAPADPSLTDFGLVLPAAWCRASP